MIGDKPAEEDPLRTAALLRAIGDVAQELIIAKDGDGRFIYVNAAAARVMGRPAPEILGRTNLDIADDPAEAQAIMANDRRIVASGTAEVIEEVYTSPDGTTRTYRSAKTPMRGADGEVIGIANIARDITDHLRSLNALRDSERQLKLITDSVPVLISYVDRQQHYRYNNRGYEEWFGVSAEELRGKHLRDVIGEEAYAKARPNIEAALRGERLSYEAFRTYGRAGPRYIHADYVPDVSAEGEVVGYYALIQDLSDRYRAEEGLREAESRLRMATEAAEIGIWDYDPVADVLQWDSQCRALFGVSPDAPVNYRDSFVAGLHDEDRAPTLAAVYAALAPDGPGSYDVEYRTVGLEDGVVRWVAASGRAMFEDGQAVRFIGTIRDISQRKRIEAELRELNETLEQRVDHAIALREQAEEALRQAQKMEAVGQLTGGIAHDFNNLLTVVIGNIDMALRAQQATGGDPRTQRALDHAQRGAERAAALTQRLLAFSRRQPLDPKPLDINKLVLGMSDLLARALGEMIKVEIVTSPGLWRVEADPNQLEAAILNLVVNGRDAMPAGGNLTIETGNTRLDESYAAAQAEVAPGPYVMIAVTDTGTGMAREVATRVFEPFFTTKEVGRGTGLGLSQVYGFVKQSGGNVKIYSEEGEGTTVKLYLPRLLVDHPAEEEPKPEVAEIGHHEESILVVEDDDDVRAFTVEILRATGYRVLEAHDGPSALRLLERQTEPLDLLFTDVVMPGMSGRDLADIARVRQPGVKVLFTSGYTRDAIIHGGRLETGVDMIAKPFTFQALSQKVRDMLDKGQSGRLLCVQPADADAAICAALREQGFSLDQAATAGEALGRVRANAGRYDAVILDSALQDRSGESIANAIRSLFRDVPVLLLVEPDEAAALRERFADDPCTDVAEKPIAPERLAEQLRELGVRCLQQG